MGLSVVDVPVEGNVDSANSKQVTAAGTSTATAITTAINLACPGAEVVTSIHASRTSTAQVIAAGSALRGARIHCRTPVRINPTASATSIPVHIVDQLRARAAVGK